MSEKYIIPIFVPHLGCPNACTYCNQKSISGQQKEVTEDEVRATIEKFLKSFVDDKIEREIAFFGGSFTAIDSKIQEKLLKVAYEYIKQGKVSSIRLSTRPDYIDKERLNLLKRYGVKVIELGVQSSNDYILTKSKRGHTFADVKKASKLIKRQGFTLGHQMMVGLPESTKLDELKTAKDLAKLKPKMIRIYPVLVIKHTELEREYNNKEYIPISLPQAVETTKELYKFFTHKKITVIRMGLQNTDVISNPENLESEVVAGPYHEAFGQLVYDSIWYDKIVDRVKKFNVKVMKIQIEANPSDISNIVGHKRENIEKLKTFYDLDVKIKENKNLKNGKFEIHILKTYQDLLKNK